MNNSFQNITISQHTDKDFDLPFDLNNLCNFNYSFDVLKAAIEYLAR